MTGTLSSERVKLKKAISYVGLCLISVLLFFPLVLFSEHMVADKAYYDFIITMIFVIPYWF